METKSPGSRPSMKAPAEYFTGAVRQDPLMEAPELARVRRSASPSSPARGLPGIRILWEKR
jgi:hypothetical protein